MTNVTSYTWIDHLSQWQRGNQAISASQDTLNYCFDIGAVRYECQLLSTGLANITIFPSNTDNTGWMDLSQDTYVALSDFPIALASSLVIFCNKYDAGDDVQRFLLSLIGKYKQYTVYRDVTDYGQHNTAII